MAGYLKNLVKPHTKQFANMLRCTDKQMLVDGPRNCGKSLQLFVYLFGLHCKYPGFQSAIVRAEARTIYTTLWPQIIKHILYFHPKHKANPFRLYGGDKRPSQLEWKNGGTTFFGGMDDAGKILGGAYDLIIYSQGEREEDQSKWNDLMACAVGGRAGNWFLKDGSRMWQGILDCNPSRANHWILSEVEKGNITRFKMTHRDHPLMYLPDGTQTEYGRVTIDGLKLQYSGTPHLYKRMVEGIWGTAEGAVFPDFGKDCIEDKLQDTSGPAWNHYGGMDLGWDDPTCYLWAAHNKDSDVLLFYKEWKRSQLTVDQHYAAIKANTEHNIRWTVSDHDKQVVEEFKKAGLKTRPAKKDIPSGLSVMNNRIHNGKFKVYKDLLIEEDPRLRDNGKPLHLIDEMYQAKYPEKKTGGRRDDLPVPGDEHSIDPARYICKQIEKGSGSMPKPKVSSTSQNVPGALA